MLLDVLGLLRGINVDDISTTPLPVLQEEWKEVIAATIKQTHTLKMALASCFWHHHSITTASFQDDEGAMRSELHHLQNEQLSRQHVLPTPDIDARLYAVPPSSILTLVL